jgi:hypothetical protein
MHRMVVVLPAPVRVEEAEDLSLLHFQVNASQCLDLAISLGQSLHPYGGLSPSTDRVFYVHDRLTDIHQISIHHGTLSEAMIISPRRWVLPPRLYPS